MTIAISFATLAGCAQTSAVTTAPPAAPGAPVANDGTCGNLDNVVNIMWAEGDVSSWPMGCDREVARGLAAARTLGARDLGCAADQVDARANPIDQYVLVAECNGRRAAYFYFTAGYGETRNLPGYERRRVEARTHLLTRLTPERATAALRAVNAFITTSGQQRNMPSAEELLARYVPLLEAAAHDLRCSASDIVPSLLHLNPSMRQPVAEGCGVRATYLPIAWGQPVLILSQRLRIDAN